MWTSRCNFFITTVDHRRCEMNKNKLRISATAVRVASKKAATVVCFM